MKPVTQTEIGRDNPRANCLMASLASILECELPQLPDVHELEVKGMHWWGAMRDALLPHRLVPVIYNVNAPEFPAIAPIGYHVAVGKSPRSEQDHAVVALDGKVVHDPHPTRAGLDGGIRWWIILAPLMPDPFTRCPKCGREWSGTRFCVDCQTTTETIWPHIAGSQSHELTGESRGDR